MGRKASITKRDVELAASSIAAGESVTAVCERLSCSRTSLYRAAKRNGVTLSAAKLRTTAKLVEQLAEFAREVNR